jgi:hypothetical protein
MQTHISPGTTAFPSLGDDPAVIEALEIILGTREAPPDMRRNQRYTAIDAELLRPAAEAL